MRRMVFCSLLSIVLIVPFLASAQQSGLVRVGVAASQLVDNQWVLNWTPQARWQRDQVVNDINRRQPDKNRQIKLAAVALAKTAPSDALSEARGKSCEYVVLVQVSYPGRFALDNAPQPSTLVDSNQPAFPGPETQIGIIGYQLHRVSDDAVVSQQTYASPLAPTPSIAMQLVNSVSHAIVRMAP